MTAAHHPGVRPEWLALSREPALDPHRPIVDAHHHLWDKPDDRYTADELAEDAAAGHRIVATVCVEGDTAYRPGGPEELRCVGETEMVRAEGERARGPAIAAAIVARADLDLGRRVGEVLDAHAEASGGRFRGIRYSTPWHPDPSARGSARLAPPGLLYDAAFREGLDELRRRDLVFDAWMYHTQLADLADLAAAMPDLRIVLDHVGGPLGIGPYAGRKDEVFADWRHWMGRLAAFPNVALKFSGLGMRLFGFGFAERSRPPGSDELEQAWRPYFDVCMETFGPSRTMFASNFPVDKGAASYVAVWNAFKRLAANGSEDERKALFLTTASSTYSLKLTVA